jgi:hypothetical protein
VAGPFWSYNLIQLSSLRSRSLGLSTSIVEALLAYNMVQSPVSADEVAQELAEILASQDDPVSKRRAYNAVANIFDDVFQGAYWEAIQALSPADRVQLLTMAALGTPAHGWATDWILEDLLESCDERAVPAFVVWSMGVNANAFCSRDAAKCFMYAVIGCAQFLKGPLPFVKSETENDRAWETYAGILYWMHKPGLAGDEMRASCAPLWERLRTELAFEAVDPLFHMEKVAWRLPSGQGHFLKALCADFPEDFRHILEFGLNNRSRLTSMPLEART